VGESNLQEAATGRPPPPHLWIFAEINKGEDISDGKHTDISESGGFQAEIYEFAEMPEETGSDIVECRISFQEEANKRFPDGGRAIRWCLERAKEYYLNT